MNAESNSQGQRPPGKRRELGTEGMANPSPAPPQPAPPVGPVAQTTKGPTKSTGSAEKTIGPSPVTEHPLPKPAAQPQPATDGAQPGKKPEAGFIDLDNFLRMAIAQGVSDIHLHIGDPPMLRQDGDIRKTQLPPVSYDAMQAFIRGIIPGNILAKVKEKTDFDFSFEMKGVARFRVNLFHEINQPGLVLRIIPMRIPTIEELGLPSIFYRFTEMPKGIILVTGPTGSGKSTTLAAMLNYINVHQSKHIITLEDPIEYFYKNEKGVVTQRQLGTDTDTFPNGIKYALRQDPDVMLIGELRDRETMMSALHAAETGHLVFSTLHTNDAVQTINRIINAFDPYERESIRRQLSDVLQGTIAQRLVKKMEGKGRVAVAETMLVTPAVRDYIQHDDIDGIYQLIKSNDYDGVCSLNASLVQAHRNGLISVEEAMKASQQPDELQQMLRGAYQGSGRY